MRPSSADGLFLKTALCCVVVILSATLAGCGSSASDPATRSAEDPVQSAEGAVDTTPPVVNPRDRAVPPNNVTALRVLTVEPGWTVFVNGIPAATAEGQPLLTPCALHLSAGEWRITVSRPGIADQSQRALVPEIRELQFESGQPAPEGQISAVEAPLRLLAPGESTPLVSLNSPARDACPFVSPDGLTIAFASDRSEGRAIYLAMRPGPEHHFDTPRQTVLTRGADRPASPSLSQDGLLLAYLLPERSRVWGLRSEDPAGVFLDRKPLVFDDQSRSPWRSTSCRATDSESTGRQTSTESRPVSSRSARRLTSRSASPCRTSCRATMPACRQIL